MQLSLVCYGWVWFGVDEFGLVWMSLAWCSWVQFGVDEFGLVWLNSVWFDEVDFLKCSRSASQLSFTNLLSQGCNLPVEISCWFAKSWSCSYLVALQFTSPHTNSQVDIPSHKSTWMDPYLCLLAAASSSVPHPVRPLVRPLVRPSVTFVKTPIDMVKDKWKWKLEVLAVQISCVMQLFKSAVLISWVNQLFKSAV